MRNALSITFKDTPHTDHLIQFIENKFKRLKKKHGDMRQCSVTVTTPHQHQRQGTPRQVTVNACVPGRQLSAKRLTDSQKGVDLYSAISDAFFAIEIQAEARVQGKVSYKNFRRLSPMDAFHFSN
ncbi:MAG: HPF/RaiA family ribosome-associated protein [Deltaproteobacteria bacterium]|nr:HPF/RaiA family ribosome-associated protein [Deltaproteobacteria bacterium]